MSSYSNNGVSGAMTSLNPQQQTVGSLGAGTLGGNGGGGQNSGGMDELLPLVMQLTKPEQVRQQQSQQYNNNHGNGAI